MMSGMVNSLWIVCTMNLNRWLVNKLECSSTLLQCYFLWILGMTLNTVGWHVIKRNIIYLYGCNTAHLEKKVDDGWKKGFINLLNMTCITIFPIMHTNDLKKATTDATQKLYTYCCHRCHLFQGWNWQPYTKYSIK